MKLLDKSLNCLFFWAMLLAGALVLLGLDMIPLALMAGLLALCLLSRRAPEGWAAPCIFLLALILRLGVVMTVHPEPIQDFARVLEASRLFSRGDYSFQETRYFQGWAGQTGQVIYQGTLLKLWDDVLIIKLSNALCAAGITALVYLTARRFFSEGCSRMAALLYACSPLSLSLAPVLTNQHSSAMFVCLGIYLLCFPPKAGPRRYLPFIRYGLAGLCMALANALRPDGPLFLVACGAYFLFGMVKGRDRLLHCGLGLLLFAGAYLLFYNSICWGIIAAGVNANGLSTQNFWLKFVHGFDQDSRGWFSAEVYNAVEAMADRGLDAAAIAQAEKEMLREELSAGLGSILKLFADKEAALWMGSGIAWGFGHLEAAHPTAYALVRRAEGGFAFSTFALAVLGFLYSHNSRKKGRAGLESLLPAFVIFSTFAVYLFIEVQPRYVYSSQPAVYILAAGGMELGLWCLRTLRARAREAG